MHLKRIRTLGGLYMKTVFALSFSLVALTGCSKIQEMNDLVNQSTCSINANTDMIAADNETIRRNAEMVRQSNRTIDENRRLLQQASK